MKKFVLVGLTAISMFGLSACSSSPSEPSESKQTSSQSKSSKYDSIVKELKSSFDKKTLTVEVKKNISSSEIQEPHTEIEAVATGDLKSDFEQLVNASDNGTITPEQKSELESIRQKVHDIAQKLTDDTTVITVSYEMTADNSQVLAKSSKSTDYITVSFNLN